jgi:hypothetical protein
MVKNPIPSLSTEIDFQESGSFFSKLTIQFNHFGNCAIFTPFF